jgi:hypothetical protein
LAVAADGPVEVVKSILDANIDVNEVHATTGHTGLHLAAKAGKDDILQLMLDKVLSPSNAGLISCNSCLIRSRGFCLL